MAPPALAFRGEQILPAQTLPSLAPHALSLLHSNLALRVFHLLVVAQAACGGFPKNCSLLFLRANIFFGDVCEKC